MTRPTRELDGDPSVKKHQYSIALTDYQVRNLVDEARLRGYRPWEVLRHVLDEWISRRDKPMISASMVLTSTSPHRPAVARVR